MGTEMTVQTNKNEARIKTISLQMYKRIFAVMVGITLMEVYLFSTEAVRRATIPFFLISLIFIVLIVSCFSKDERIYSIPVGSLLLFMIVSIAIMLARHGSGDDWMFLALLCVLEIVFCGFEIIFLFLRSKAIGRIATISAVLCFLYGAFISGTFLREGFRSAGYWVVAIFVVSAFVVAIVRKCVSLLFILLVIGGSITIACGFVRYSNYLSYNMQVGNVICVGGPLLLLLSLTCIGINLFSKENRIVTKMENSMKKNSFVTNELFCPSCGMRFPAGKKFCDQCGSPLSELAHSETKLSDSITASNDTPSIGVAILGGFIPLAGFIMWVSWNTTMPLKARSAGRGALIGFIAYILLVVGYYSFIISLLH